MITHEQEQPLQEALPLVDPEQETRELLSEFRPMNEALVNQQMYQDFSNRIVILCTIAHLENRQYVDICPIPEFNIIGFNYDQPDINLGWMNETRLQGASKKIFDDLRAMELIPQFFRDDSGYHIRACWEKLPKSLTDAAEAAQIEYHAQKSDA